MTVPVTQKIVHCWVCDCANYGIDAMEVEQVFVSAETASKAKYKAYQAWNDAFRPTFKQPFKYFLKYILLRIERVT